MYTVSCKASYVHLFPFMSAFQFLSVSVGFFPFLSFFVHFSPFLFIYVRFCQVMFLSVCFCLFLFVSVRFCLFLSVSVLFLFVSAGFCLFWSVFVCFCPFFLSKFVLNITAFVLKICIMSYVMCHVWQYVCPISLTPTARATYTPSDHHYAQWACKLFFIDYWIQILLQMVRKMPSKNIYVKAQFFPQKNCCLILNQSCNFHVHQDIESSKKILVQCIFWQKTETQIVWVWLMINRKGPRSHTNTLRDSETESGSDLGTNSVNDPT